MQITIDVQESVAEKVLKLLQQFGKEVKIVRHENSDSLDIEIIEPDDPDYAHILKARKERELHPENYVDFDEINWN
jgi:hypothetical protein